MSKKLFIFNRDIPEPFHTAPKLTKGVHSQYSSTTDSTLTATVAKAVMAYAKMQSGEVLGGLGQVNGKSVAEYKSSKEDEYHLVVHDPSTGNLLALVYNYKLKTMETYVVGAKARDGAALMLALFPELMKDSEFDTQLKTFCGQQLLGFPDMNMATTTLAILCDNAYRRITNSACPAHVNAVAAASGNVTRISKTHLDSNVFEPRVVLAGEFSVLSQRNASTKYTPSAAMPLSDFVGMYTLNPGRTLSRKEQSMIPELQPWYILPEEIVSVCKHAQASTGKATQMRNFALRGPAGTGKTKGAEAIAAGLGLPYVKYTCSANSEVYDFIGQVFPDTQGSPGTEELQALEEMGGITYENVAKMMHLPDLADMDYDPAGVFESLTGKNNANATSQDCMAIVLNLVTERVRELCFAKPESSGQTYTYIETDFIRALKYGWLVEVQEPTCIMQPGVLVGLNSLLEQTGTITLPTGELIRRHPYAVVVITTNISYEGCRSMNQSFMDRMNLVQDIDLPDEKHNDPACHEHHRLRGRPYGVANGEGDCGDGGLLP